MLAVCTASLKTHKELKRREGYTEKFAAETHWVSCWGRLPILSWVALRAPGIVLLVALAVIPLGIPLLLVIVRLLLVIVRLWIAGRRTSRVSCIENLRTSEAMPASPYWTHFLPPALRPSILFISPKHRPTLHRGVLTHFGKVRSIGQQRLPTLRTQECCLRKRPYRRLYADGCPVNMSARCTVIEGKHDSRER